jgi:MEMO1 family protein
MTSIRPAAVAGSFYPATGGKLRALLNECCENHPLGPRGKREPNPMLVAGLVPHAGLQYSGACGAHLYAQLDSSVRHIILLGVDHHARGYRASLSPWQCWETELGQVAVDNRLCEFLESRVSFLKRDAAAHAEEHSIEIQLPFLQGVLSEFTFVPISLAHLALDECAELGRALADGCKAAAKTVVLASSDLSHYLSPKKTDELDRLVLARVLSLDPEGLLSVVEGHGITMCGVLPTAVMLFAARELGVKQARLLKHYHSGDVAPMRKVVGYASVALEL